MRISSILTGKTTDQIETEIAKPLPGYVTRQVINELAHKIVEAHNSQDNEADWNLYGEYAKAQMNREQFNKDTLRVYDLFGPIVDVKYMYHDSGGNAGNLTFYNLYFKVNLTEHCKLSDTATMKVSIASDGSEIQLVGFRLDSDS